MFTRIFLFIKIREVFMAATWFSIKAIEGALSSLTTPVLNVIKSGFDGARANPHIAIISTLLLSAGSYLLMRRYRKEKEASDLSDINQSLRAINNKLRAQDSTLNNHTNSMASLAGTLLTLTEPLMNCRASGINVERILGENHSAIVRQFGQQNATLETMNRSLGTLKAN